jgi:hypothetical protein
MKTISNNTKVKTFPKSSLSKSVPINDFSDKKICNAIKYAKKLLENTNFYYSDINFCNSQTPGSPPRSTANKRSARLSPQLSPGVARSARLSPQLSPGVARSARLSPQLSSGVARSARLSPQLSPFVQFYPNYNKAHSPDFSSREKILIEIIYRLGRELKKCKNKRKSVSFNEKAKKENGDSLSSHSKRHRSRLAAKSAVKKK